jgi:hypothetical protein
MAVENRVIQKIIPIKPDLSAYVIGQILRQDDGNSDTLTIEERLILENEYLSKLRTDYEYPLSIDD